MDKGRFQLGAPLVAPLLLLLTLLPLSAMARQLRESQAGTSYPVALLARKDVRKMTTSLYVGNLTYDTTNQDLCNLFSEYSATDCRVIPDRGFGFVEVPDDRAKQAIEAMNGKDFRGRPLTVNEARPRPPRGGAGRSRGGYSGGRESGGYQGKSGGHR